jgi:hypothetical protein
MPMPLIGSGLLMVCVRQAGRSAGVTAIALVSLSIPLDFAKGALWRGW